MKPLVASLGKEQVKRIVDWLGWKRSTRNRSANAQEVGDEQPMSFWKRSARKGNIVVDVLNVIGIVEHAQQSFK
jgi:hypothetical protein